MKMIAVTGASGQLGRLVLDGLLEKIDAKEIVAIARSVDRLSEYADKGVNVRFGDYSDPTSLDKALEGVTKLLLISSSEVGQRALQHQNVIEAAQKRDLQLFAYTSLLKADTSPMMLAGEHKQTEDMIAQAGLPSVILRNGWYSENYVASVPSILGMGTVYGCAGHGKISSAPRKDYADACVAVLLSEEEQSGKLYELAGDSSFDLATFAALIAEAGDQEISFQNLTQSEYAQVLRQAGLPDGFADMLADSETQAEAGWLYDDSKTLSQLIGRSTEPLKTTIENALN